MDTGRCLHVLEGHSDSVFCVAWRYDDLRILSGGADHTVRVWDPETGQCLSTLEGHTDTVYDVAFSPDGNSVLSCSADKTVRLWVASTGRCLHVFEGHTGTVRSVAWEVDGTQFLSSSDDSTLRLWDVETRSWRKVFTGHKSWVLRTLWSVDQRYALSSTSNSESTVRLWDVETERCLCVFERSKQYHQGILHGLAISADQRYAFSGDERGGIHVWDLSRFIAERQASHTVTSASPPPPSDPSSIHQRQGSRCWRPECRENRIGPSFGDWPMETERWLNCRGLVNAVEAERCSRRTGRGTRNLAVGFWRPS